MKYAAFLAFAAFVLYNGYSEWWIILAIFFFMKEWPKIGSKVTFTGTRMFWFVNMVKDANELLEIGKEYTIAKVELASSWCGVVLKEFPENTFSLSWFEYDPELTTNEQLKVEERYIPITLEELRDAKRNQP